MAEENGNGAVENDGPMNDAPAEERAREDSTTDTAEVAALQAELAAMKERALRALADAENTRKRAERERDDARLYAITRFARDLLSVSDNLSRALAACPAETREAAEDSLKAVFQGVEATERELQAILTRHGVTPIEAEGAKFDPNLHQAIAQVPGEGRPPGTVVNVIQNGYTIGDRLLRAALVTVALDDSSAASQPPGGTPGGN